MSKSLQVPARFLGPLANVNKDAEIFVKFLRDEKEAIARMLAASPRPDFNIDWYRGRMGLLQELIDGATGKVSVNHVNF